MKVVAFNGSARQEGNTTRMIRAVFDELVPAGIETELLHLAGQKIQGCMACYTCFSQKNQRCAVTDDVVNLCLEKMLAADGIILASPTYFADMTAQMKALIDRAGFVARANGDMLKRKVGAAISVARRGGAIHTFDSLNHFFFISQMIVPGANYWNMGFGLDKGDVARDEEAMETMRVLGRNMAWLMKALVSIRS